MQPIIHVGPPKTASTSLQESVIPLLERPYQVKSDWTRALVRSPQFQAPEYITDDMVISDEALAESARRPPEEIVRRLLQAVSRGTVIYVKRNVVDLFYSLYSQQLVNSLHQKDDFVPQSIDTYFDTTARLYEKNRLGFFCMIDVARMRAAFEPHYRFEVLDFDLLKDGTFAGEFCQLCGSDLRPAISHANSSSDSKVEHAIAINPHHSSGTKDLVRNYHAHPQLSRDRMALLQSRSHQSEWPASGVKIRRSGAG